LVAFLSAGLFSGCATTQNGDQILKMPEAVQVQAHVDCQVTKGFYAPEAIHISRMNGDRTLVLTKSGPIVSPDLAQYVNQCARTKLLSNQGRSIVDVQSHLVVLSDKKTNLKDARRTLSPKSRRTGCVAGSGVVQGGTKICPGY
jgi:hypothetical protein